MRQTGNTFEHKKLNVTALLQAVTENTSVSGIIHTLDKIGFVQSTDDLIKSQLHGKLDPGISHIVSAIITLMAVLLLVLMFLLIKFYCKTPEPPPRPRQTLTRFNPVIDQF